MNDDSASIKEVFDMFVPMLITSFEMLGEHDLIKPTSAIPNVGIITLLILAFLRNTARDFDIDTCHEILRAADKAGVVLEPRKELSLTQEDLDSLRTEYKKGPVLTFNWKTQVRCFFFLHEFGLEANSIQVYKF